MSLFIITILFFSILAELYCFTNCSLMQINVTSIRLKFVKYLVWLLLNFELPQKLFVLRFIMHYSINIC